MRPGFSGFVGTLLLLATHGILLWVLVPSGFVFWLATFQGFGKRRTSPAVFIGWLDHNLLVALMRGPFRYLVTDKSMHWIAARDRTTTTHRIWGMAFF